ncbi:hypothetical protein NBRC116599_30790 [Aquicoccus sp. SU-CL01552]
MERIRQPDKRWLRGARRFPTLIETGCGCIWNGMTPESAPCFDLQDHARLRERFFGADRTVLARL